MEKREGRQSAPRTPAMEGVALSPPSGEMMHRWRRKLFFGKRQALCLLIAPLPWPRKHAWQAALCQHSCHNKAYTAHASKRAQPVGDVGGPGPIVGREREEDRMVSPQSNGLSQVGEAERCGRLAREHGTHTISAMSTHDSSSEGA